MMNIMVHLNLLLATEWVNKMIYEEYTDKDFLNDLDRGNSDCQRGETAKEDESEAYYIAYGARYVLEQNQQARSKT